MVNEHESLPEQAAQPGPVQANWQPVTETLETRWPGPYPTVRRHTSSINLVSRYFQELAVRVPGGFNNMAIGGLTIMVGLAALITTPGGKSPDRRPGWNADALAIDSYPK